MAKHQLNLSILQDRLAISRLDPKSQIPNWAFKGDFYSITSTKEELSIISDERYTPSNISRDLGWRPIKVEGPIELDLPGVAVSVASPISNAGIGVFIIATYETDYVLVKEEHLGNAINALIAAGHSILSTDG